ncbi:MAG: GFA family protein [Geminicoccaceae bacterium]
MGEKVLLETGGCMCGIVRYEAIGAPCRTIHCHCEDCRKHTGAPAATLAVYKADQVKFSGGERGIFRSSPGVERAFCSKCGTSLTFETDLRSYGPICALHISTFDNPNALMPTHHSFYSERISWFDIADDLPRYAGLVVDGSLVRHGPVTLSMKSLENFSDGL